MPANLLDTPLLAYLSLREALGFPMPAEKRLLPEFGAYVHTQQDPHPIRAQHALEWACWASAHRRPNGAARRLGIARGFLRDLQAAVPATEVPAPGLLPTPRRPQPFLFTPIPIAVLIEAAHASRPRGSWRPHTFASVLGLLASTGLRVGEALRLQIDQINLDLNPPQLHILETKFRKSLMVPLHPSAAEHLRHYQAQRARWHYEGVSEAFFVSERGQPLQQRAHRWRARPVPDVVSSYRCGDPHAALVSARAGRASTSGMSPRRRVLGT